MKLIVNSLADQNLFLNISANVGVASPNKTVDVQLVQFSFYALSKNIPNAPLPPDVIGAAAAVVVGAPYNGQPADPLTIAIRADQRFRGGTQDGHVSVMQGPNLSYDGNHSFQLLRIQNHLRQLMLRDNIPWPRIDLHRLCPPELCQSVKRSF